MVELVPMGDEDFRRYMETAVEDYALTRFKCGGCSMEEARGNSRDSFKELLGDGLKTSGQHLFCISAPGINGAVGMVWVALREQYETKSAYIYDIQVDPSHRGKGFGGAALKLAEEFARQWGAVRMSLNVWDWNRRARALYERSGYAPIAIGMSKV